MKKVNPKFKTSLYAVERKTKNGDYSVVPSLRETVSNNIKISSYSNATDALKEINKYATNQGADLSQYAYLSALMNNPTPETAQKALDHYTIVLNNIETMITSAQKQKNANRK